MSARFDARVVAAFGRHWLVRDASSTLRHAVRRGKRGDVVVGDLVQCEPSGADATIVQVRPRTTLLYRAAEHRTKELAANVGRMVLVYAPRRVARFLWRALIAAQSAGIDTLVVLNKTDLASESAAARATLDRLAALGCATLALSAKHEPALARAALAARLKGHINLLVGQSGMGKSTLLNLLVPDANARTQEFSAALNLGKQTTTAARWFDLPGGGALIDTPGFQEFGLAHLSAARIAATLPDFAPHLGQCRFSDCRHLEEPGCAVRAAVPAAGTIDAARYAFYRLLAQAGRTR